MEIIVELVFFLCPFSLRRCTCHRLKIPFYCCLFAVVQATLLCVIFIRSPFLQFLLLFSISITLSYHPPYLVLHHPPYILAYSIHTQIFIGKEECERLKKECASESDLNEKCANCEFVCMFYIMTIKAQRIFIPLSYLSRFMWQRYDKSINNDSFNMFVRIFNVLKVWFYGFSFVIIWIIGFRVLGTVPKNITYKARRFECSC